MSDYRENFKRKEIKYKLSFDQRRMIEDNIIANGMSLTNFGESLITSIYLDTPNKDVISRSLEKPLYKEKVRLRWYGSDGLENTPKVFFELKKKFKGIVYKRRVGVTPLSAVEFIKSGDPAILVLDTEDMDTNESTSYIEKQIMQEIIAACKRHENMHPAAKIEYFRSPYEDGDDFGLRVTFDKDLVGTDLMSGDRISLIEDSESIMEIKCNGSYPLWLVKILDAAKTYPHSFSKYGELYMGNTLRKKDIEC